MKRRELLIRLISGMFLCNGTFLTASAQAEKEELQLNTDAVKLIQFDFSHSEGLSTNPQAAPMDKPWMKFKTEIGIPRNMTDTLKVKKPDNYVRLLPYSIWTRFGEDPVYDVLVFGRKKELEIVWTLNLNSGDYGRDYSAPIVDTHSAVHSVGGGGICIDGLDFNKFLTDNFTARGRMLRHNRKHANAWKTYQSYRPTLSDSLKMPTHYQRIVLADKTKTSNEQTDTINRADTLTHPKHTPDSTRNNGSWYEFIRQKAAEDSIRRAQPKKMRRQNVYEVEKQIRRLKELQD